MRVLLLTNLVYALVLPLLELFVAAYILRKSHEPALVVVYTLGLYTGIPFSFLLNGVLLRVIPIARLYSIGMLLTGIAMSVMMGLPVLGVTPAGASGLVMGLSVGFFWANRDFLALSSTDDSSRNYYFSLETVFYTLTFILMPAVAGAFISGGKVRGWYAAETAYRILTGVVFVLTAIASWLVHRGNFAGPPREPFIYFRFHRDWYWMLALGVGKGLGQAAIFVFPVVLVMNFIGREGSLGALVSAGAAISAAMLYGLGRWSKPRHRLMIFGAGLLVFLAGGTANLLLFSGAGVIAFQICTAVARPLLDAAYYPIQMHVIDRLSAIEQRNKFAYLFHHEYALYCGRLAGCIGFLVVAKLLSPAFALRYVLAAMALIQALSLPIAARLIRKFTGDESSARGLKPAGAAIDLVVFPDGGVRDQGPTISP